MGNQVEESVGIASGSQRHHHETQLADRRIGQYFLEVGLCDGYRCRHKCGNGTDDGDKGEGIGRKHHEYLGDQVNACGNHGCGMDQGRNGCRAFHGIGKPNVERPLGRFSHGAHENTDACNGQHGRVVKRQLA